MQQRVEESATSSDGYGNAELPFLMSDPELAAGWQIIRRQRAEDGEHIWNLIDDCGRPRRWLEDEAGLEWAYRTSVVQQTQMFARTVSSNGVQ